MSDQFFCAAKDNAAGWISGASSSTHLPQRSRVVQRQSDPSLRAMSNPTEGRLKKPCHLPGMSDD